MIADRTYMRDTYNPSRVVPVLIVVLIVAFVLQSIFFFYGDFNSYRYFGLTRGGLARGWVWQLLTFQFMHSVPLPFHVLFNCLGLYFFGRSVEETLGSKKFLTLYLLCGVAGGLLQVLTTYVPRHVDASVVGASAGVCGMIAVFCMLYPMRELTAWIYFFPVTIRAIYLLWFLGLLSLFGTIVPFDHVAHAAHLGGILLGIGYVKWMHDSDVLLNLWQRLRPRRRARPIVKVRFPQASSASWQGENARRPDDGDFISKEVDPILDKIRTHGIHSLTDRERQTLDDARKKMGRD